MFEFNKLTKLEKIENNIYNQQCFQEIMVETRKSQELGEITPPFAGLAGLSIVAWIFFGIFTRFDDDKFYFTLTMFLSGVLAAYQLRHSRVNRNPVQRGAVAIFVMVWLAIFTFTKESSSLEYESYSYTLKQVEFVALLPLALIWVPPYNPEKFFGLTEIEDSDKVHAIWRGAVLFLILINIINLEGHWYSEYLEFLILLPMINETVKLQRMSEDRMPVLTLFIQTEMTEKFAVPISMMKSVFFLMVAFLFEILNSRLWLLIILGYFTAGMMWGISSLVPKEMKSDNDSKDDFAESVREFFGAEESKGGRKRKRRRDKRKEKKAIEKSMKEGLVKLKESETADKTTDLVISKSNKLSTDLANGSIQEKAHALGKRVRSGIEKPYYTLNHILSTLKEEDFSEAWRVAKDGFVFPSTRGKWSPGKGLILFPVELEKYDYRRSNEVLLLGFNRPFESKEGGFKMEFGGESKSNARITDNSIRFGEFEFNTRSLIVTQDQWDEIKTKLEVVTQDDDISHTGFKTLNQMQEVLASLSDKWLEVRLTAQEAAVNFIAGLLGSSEPIFIPREGLDTPSYPEIEGNIVDTTVEEEDN